MILHHFTFLWGLNGIHVHTYKWPSASCCFRVLGSARPVFGPLCITFRAFCPGKEGKKKSKLWKSIVGFTYLIIRCITGVHVYHLGCWFGSQPSIFSARRENELHQSFHVLVIVCLGNIPKSINNRWSIQCKATSPSSYYITCLSWRQEACKPTCRQFLPLSADSSS